MCDNEESGQARREDGVLGKEQVNERRKTDNADAAVPSTVEAVVCLLVKHFELAAVASVGEQDQRTSDWQAGYKAACLRIGNELGVDVLHVASRGRMRQSSLGKIVWTVCGAITHEMERSEK